ncbi:response regulator [Agaribacterium sp. ZY112]|uniref:response regulator n=1 Tax=Agaribacterium sp. ZY112 TaxID=3233574 RepID=UPI003525366B
MSKHIVIVEDESTLADIIKSYCEAAGFSCSVLNDGAIASQWFEEHQADLAILDLMLPGKDGLTLCRELQQHSPHTVIIMATAKTEEVDRLLGLEIGADDYICKPYSPRELIARIKAIFRRLEAHEEPYTQEIRLEEQRLCVVVKGNELQLTAVEMALFSLLFHKPGHIFSRSYIMDSIYNDYRIVSDRTVDSHIKKLRKKLNEAAPELQLIHSIYGAGYKYEFQKNED